MNEFYRWREWYIPERMGGGIRRYVDHGIQPGDFLTAVIQNNLHESVGSADDENRKNLPAYVSYFHQECPRICWGSPDRMSLWMERKRKEREKKVKE